MWNVIWNTHKLTIASDDIESTCFIFLWIVYICVLSALCVCGAQMFTVDGKRLDVPLRNFKCGMYRMTNVWNTWNLKVLAIILWGRTMTVTLVTRQVKLRLYSKSCEHLKVCEQNTAVSTWGGGSTLGRVTSLAIPWCPVASLGTDQLFWVPLLQNRL